MFTYFIFKNHSLYFIPVLSSLRKGRVRKTVHSDLSDRTHLKKTGRFWNKNLKGQRQSKKHRPIYCRSCPYFKLDHGIFQSTVLVLVTSHQSLNGHQMAYSVKMCTYRCNFLIVIISVAVTLILLTFLYHPQIKEFQLPIYYSYFKYYLPVKLGNDDYYSFKSTCSRAADKRGPNQRVIAYSLYGNLSKEDVFNKYVSPLKRTINLIPLIYPGTTIALMF